MTLKDRIGRRDDPTSTYRERVKESLSEALAEVGDFDAVYKSRFDEASTLAEKSRIAREFLRLHPRHAAKSQWLATVIDLTTHSSGATKQQRRSKWDSYPDAKRRLTIVLTNQLSAEEFCKAFDEARIGFPPGWEHKYGVTTWVEAYAEPKARGAIDRLISDDRHRRKG